MAFLSVVASPTPMLRVILVIFGTSITLLSPSSSINEGTTVSR